MAVYYKADDYEKQASDISEDMIEEMRLLENYKINGDNSSKEFKKQEKITQEIINKYNGLTKSQHYYLTQIDWLTERFPNGEYEDVTGLCKAATIKDLEEQDFSLNPGRYVGVVIEEDGLTEEEFISEMREKQEILDGLNAKAVDLGTLISTNLKLFA